MKLKSNCSSSLRFDGHLLPTLSFSYLSMDVQVQPLQTTPLFSFHLFLKILAVGFGRLFCWRNHDLCLRQSCLTFAQRHCDMSTCILVNFTQFWMCNVWYDRTLLYLDLNSQLVSVLKFLYFLTFPSA